MAIVDLGNYVYRDTTVSGNNVFVSATGQNCSTLWFESEKAASRFIEKAISKNTLPYFNVPSGIDAGLCSTCKNYFAQGTPEWKAAVEHACKAYKARIAGSNE